MKNEDREIRQGLREYAAKIALTHTPPPADQVWPRAKYRRRRADLRRAEQPIRIMQALAIACTLVIAAWATRHAAALPILTLGRPPLLMAACATIFTSLAACWTMLRAGRQTF